MALIHITGKSYELIIENRNGWNVEAFRNRYSEVLERYDYIVGDWGYNQLRLKGFYRDGHQKATKDSMFSYATDYINEYCNFGCAYFVLEKKTDVSTERNDEDIYIDELEIVVDEPNADEEKSATISATVSEGKPSNQERKRSSQKSNDNGVEKYFEKSSEKNKQRNSNRQGSKVQPEDTAGTKSEGKKDGRPDAKQKRKEHYYRKGNRSQEKKVRANKSQSEQLSTVIE